MDSKSTQFKKILKDAQFKVTPTRLKILELLSRNKKPLCAEDIRSKMKNTDADLVTIYRTLNSFEEAGILKRVNLQRDSVYYECADRHHHHIVCLNCGDIEDFEECSLDIVSKKIVHKSTKFKTVDDHAFELFGTCTSCVGR